MPSTAPSYVSLFEMDFYALQALASNPALLAGGSAIAAGAFTYRTFYPNGDATRPQYTGANYGELVPAHATLGNKKLPVGEPVVYTWEDPRFLPSYQQTANAGFYSL
jgi:hypothetical protein